ncbi:hypothetical protein Xcel_1466 [Xylanimonas cellulosilytica DSM 15894]|uniref:Uncharacterized protein n=1 Tax=Xylanimonas cellulosilytica (strain DSM 15894 / JCM 12276 / CECT 5975 / KCTC 9989 / LMG 20990 / NBRC 107835 / XIL07) TaxID=446471 RepID=D1BS05_XYLCX|nr:hypothetical protein [Xylanimonas cellulosilytica]ACZ30497.1 hypothetical protein Xcel_1466 [Xylanimonas cellulosilytica DSM 15894]
MAHSATEDVPADMAGLLIGLTGFELLSLLSLGDEPGAQTTREHLRLPDVASDSPLLAAGVSSLILRGLCLMDGSTLEPQGDLRALVSVLRTATRWLEVNVVAGPGKQAIGGALLVGSGNGSVLLEPRPHSIWHAWPLAPTDTLPAVGVRVVKAHYDRHDTRPLAARLRLTGDAGSRAAALRFTADGRAEIAAGPAGGSNAPRPVDAATAFDALAEALS